MRRTQLYAICNRLDFALALKVINVFRSPFQWPDFESSTHHTQSTPHTQSRFKLKPSKLQHKMRWTKLYTICDWLDLALALKVIIVFCSPFQWPYFESSTHHTQSTPHTHSRFEIQTILTSTQNALNLVIRNLQLIGLWTFPQGDECFLLPFSMALFWEFDASYTVDPSYAIQI